MIAWLLKRPYTIVALLILIALLGVGAASRMPTDIFPAINVPVVSVVWTYGGMSPTEIQNRILTLHERQMPALVDDIDHIEANSYQGVGVIKVYLHEDADVSRAVAQVASSALTVLKYMPPNVTPPMVIRYGATDVPILQLSLSSRSLPDTTLNNLGQNVIRPDLAAVQGVSLPQPYGGKPRVIMVDLDPAALAAQGLEPSDISTVLLENNVIIPSGDVKIGNKDYPVTMNNSPDVIARMNDFPVKTVGGRQVFLRDVAHVHEGGQTQTNLVTQNGTPGALMTIRKTGAVSTLAVVGGVRDFLPELRKQLPADVVLTPLFDQSVFVRAALVGVLREGGIAAGLTALMILLFLGNWRLTLIVMLSIPTSILCALIIMYFTGDTLNTMTLGGFALAVGILVDDTTVGIENMDRYLEQGLPLAEAVIRGNGEVLIPTTLSTLAICIVFVPIFLLSGVARYLFSPLAEAVVLSLLASFVVARFVVPILFYYLLRGQHGEAAGDGRGDGSGDGDDYAVPAGGVRVLHHAAPTTGWRATAMRPFMAVHRGFEAGFHRFAEAYRDALAWAVAAPGATAAFFGVLVVASLALFPILGRDFFPSVDAGQMRLHVRAPAGSRIETTAAYFARVEKDVRRIVGKDQVANVLANIGLPYSGMNMAVGDTATVGTMDGELLVSLKEDHTPTAAHVADLRRQLPRDFPDCQFFFQAADIVNQVLNFGQPAPIDVRVVGSDPGKTYDLAARIAHDLSAVPGVVDSHVYQVPAVPGLRMVVNRGLAQTVDVSQRGAATSLLVTLNSSGQTVPNFWVNPKTGVSYPLVAQTPTYTVDSLQALRTMPLKTSGAPGTHSQGQLLMNVADIERVNTPALISQSNVRPVFDVDANVQGRDLYGVARDVRAVLDRDRPPVTEPVTVALTGQIDTMTRSYNGLFGGMAMAVVLVFLLMVIKFQSWLSPLIVLLAVPFALSGVCWGLFLTRTYMSVPALMGGLMCIGLATANSILVVSFADERLAEGYTATEAAVAAGYTRLRPVIMTAAAMILGMLPMALAMGEGGEQNAPLGRAVIGGLIFATFATLLFVPTMFALLHRRRPRAAREHDQPSLQPPVTTNH
jgi:multidrug efflux pump subunit AcrB